VKPKYNHLYALGFSVDSDDREGATEGEILAALSERLQELRHTGEALEAVGVPRRYWTTEPNGQWTLCHRLGSD
jgi:hypothetical protein